MSILLKGVIHGKTIELDEAPNLPDGQSVTLAVTVAERNGTPLPLDTRPPGTDEERRARIDATFGTLADEDVNEFLDQVRRDRGAWDAGRELAE